MYFPFIILSYFFYNGITGHPITISLDDCHGIFAGNWEKCSAAIARQLFIWHQWSDVTRDDRCGFPCVSQLKGRLVNFQWKWDARYICETKAPGIVGMATKFSKKGAVEWAVEDFKKKAVKAGHFQSKDVNCRTTDD